MTDLRKDTCQIIASGIHAGEIERCPLHAFSPELLELCKESLSFLLYQQCSYGSVNMGKARLVKQLKATIAIAEGAQ